MMSKINIEKMNDLESIRAARQTSVKSAGGKDKTDATNAKTEIGADKVEFSERAGEVGKMVDQLKQMPDVREAKVNALREQIAAGEYKPSGEQIADALLQDEQ